MDYKERYFKTKKELSKLEDKTSNLALLLTDTINELEERYPELKESDDERIRKELINYLSNELNNVVQMTPRTNQFEGWISWLEKQGEKSIDILDEEEREFADNVDSFREEIDNAYQRGYDEGVRATMEQQDEQKPTDTVNKKFQVGDWIIHDSTKHGRHILNVIGIEDGCYSLKSIDGYEPPLVCFDIIDEEDYHLWTIQDAKDGDVLRIENLTFIFQETTNNNVFHKDAVVAYCSYEDNEDGFGVCGPDCITDLEIITPTTKEQRDTLFAKMKEAGYEWDAEKLELKKMEEKPAWSEEDKNVWLDIKSLIDSLLSDGGNSDYTTHELQKMWDWLDTIWQKDRVHPQPVQEWSEEDEKYIHGLIRGLTTLRYIHHHKTFSGDNIDITETVEWLKSLKYRYAWKPSYLPHWTKSTLPNDNTTGFNSDYFCYKGYNINYKELFEKLPKRRLKIWVQK